MIHVVVHQGPVERSAVRMCNKKKITILRSPLPSWQQDKLAEEMGMEEDGAPGMSLQGDCSQQLPGRDIC